MRQHELLTPLKQAGLTWGLVMLSHLATEISLSQGEISVALILLRFVALLIPTTVATWFSLHRHWKPSGLITIFAILAMLSPLLLSPLRHTLFNTGYAFEMQLLIGLRNLSLVCLIWSGTLSLERIAVLTSLFALLFCISTTEDLSLIPLSVLYLLTGIGWLCTKYWSRLKTESIVGQQSGGPWFLLATAALLVCAVLFLFAIPRETRTRMVEGFLPSSGGTGAYDPYARSGVGDGDALVAATKEALSFAPIENAPFIEGQEPSLYDVFQDTYGEAKPPLKTERAIALPPELFQPNHERMAEAKKSAKSFTLQRDPPASKAHRHVKETASRAVLHLVGRVPAHLRHTVYDLFDGYEWYPQKSQELDHHVLKVVTVEDKPWIRLPGSVRFETETHMEPHALRVMNVKTNCILAPTNLQAIHIDRCDRTDLFRLPQDGIITMDRETLPSMTVIHLRSGLVDAELLDRSSVSFHAGFPEYRALPQGTGMDQIAELARQWTKGLRTDLERIAAIRRRLQEHYQLAPEMVVPDECENPVQWFLMESQQGPDYLFATAAVLMMRSLGISCRAVSGMYADPANYDFAARQTSVFPEDTHWWAEVYLGNGSWLTMEPTPGYSTLIPPRSLLTQIWIALKKGATTLWYYWPLTATLCLLAVTGVWYRRPLWWKSQVLFWHIRYRGNQPEESLRPLVLRAFELWDRQHQWTAQARPPGMTITSYFQKQETNIQRPGWTPTESRTLLESYQWAAYSPQAFPPHSANLEQVRQLCRRLLKSPRISPRHQPGINPAQKV